MADQLARLPLSLTAEWVPKTVTTDPPKLTPHEEWRLEIGLSGPAAFRLAELTYSPAWIHWGLRWDEAAEHIESSLNFFPYDWSGSDGVQVNFGGSRIAVTDPELKTDPRAHTTLLLPESATTGQVIQVCEIPRHSLTLAVLPIAEQDTERRRQVRWRLRPRLTEGVAPEVAEMASGRRHGTIDR